MVIVVNIVGSGDLGTELDLEALESDLVTPFLEYDPTNYHGLYVRLETGGPLITTYRSGKYIITGSSSKEEMTEVNNKFLSKLRELGIISENHNTGFAVKNVVCTSNLGDDVALNTLSIGLGLESTEYEPEQFPGLIYRPKSIDAVLLIFANGKVVITGSKDLNTAEHAISHLKSKMEEVGWDSS